jgi:hypothetical protein
MARNFDPRGSMSRLAQEVPFRYVGAARGMPGLAAMRRYYADRRRQREAEAQARAARKAYRDASLRGESVAVDFKTWLRLQEAKGQPQGQKAVRGRLTQGGRHLHSSRWAESRRCSSVRRP